MVFNCNRCECDFDEDMLREENDDICLLCDVYLRGDFMEIDSDYDSEEDSDYCPSPQPDSEEYETDSGDDNTVDVAYEIGELYNEFKEVGEIAGQEMVIECTDDYCDIRSRWAGIKGLDGRLSP